MCPISLSFSHRDHQQLLKNDQRVALLQAANRAEVELLGERWASSECMEAVMKFLSRPREQKANL